MEGLAVLLFLLSIVPGILLRGYVLSKLWEWFVVSTFSAPSLSIPAAIGIAITLQMFSPNPSKSKSEKSADKVVEALGHIFINPLLTLGSSNNRCKGVI